MKHIWSCASRIPLLGRDPHHQGCSLQKVAQLGALCLLEWIYRWAQRCFPQLWSRFRPSPYRGKGSSAREVAYPLRALGNLQTVPSACGYWGYVLVPRWTWLFQDLLVCSEKVWHAFPLRPIRERMCKPWPCLFFTWVSNAQDSTWTVIGCCLCKGWEKVLWALPFAGASNNFY